jgi:hypothetical protein
MGESIGGLFGALIVILVWLVLVGGGFALYMLPAIVGFARKHHQLAPIVVVNLFLGWTFLGWVLALVWSVSSTPGRTPTPPTSRYDVWGNELPGWRPPKR